MDDIDHITNLLEREEAARLKDLQAKRELKPPPSLICKSCGVSLNPVRQEYNLCIECAEDEEKLKRRNVLQLQSLKTE